MTIQDDMYFAICSEAHFETSDPLPMVWEEQRARLGFPPVTVSA